MNGGLSEIDGSGTADGPPSGRGDTLVVDDDAEVAETTALMLERHGLDAVWETSPRESLERLNERGEAIDCVVSDYRMPGMDGLELLDAVRDVSPGLPFVLFTARGSERIASAAIDAGVSGYIQKGGNEQYDRLANRVEEAIEKRRAEEALEKRRKQFETVFEHAFDGIFVLDMDEAVIVDANPRACELLAYPYDELVGTSIEAVHPDDHEEYVRIGRELVAEGDRERVESLCYTRDGETIPSDITAAPMEYDGDAYLLTIMRPRKED